MEHEVDVLNCWALELFYEIASGQYLIFWSTTIPGRFSKTDPPKDKKPSNLLCHNSWFWNFSDTKLFFDQGFKIIDGTIQKINLCYFLFLKNENKYPEPEKNIRIAKSEKLLVEYFQTLKSITVDWVDCPSAIKIPEGWIIYYDQ